MLQIMISNTMLTFSNRLQYTALFASSYIGLQLVFRTQELGLSVNNNTFKWIGLRSSSRKLPAFNLRIFHEYYFTCSLRQTIKVSSWGSNPVTRQCRLHTAQRKGWYLLLATKISAAISSAQISASIWTKFKKKKILLGEQEHTATKIESRLNLAFY